MTTTSLPRNLAELQTPAPLVDAALLAANLALMAEAWPGSRLRPHVKAHKCTELARHQRDAGHPGFTCATIREVEGMAAAGLGQDLLLANEVLDASRLGALVAAGARVTAAVDSVATLEAAVRGGVREVLIDVNVGLPRCGIAPADAGGLAELARAAGLEVRGVMGYEGHTMMVADRADRARQVAESMALLEQAHAAVGGPIRSAGGTGSWDLNVSATELQAGSYALMDTEYAAHRPAVRAGAEHPRHRHLGQPGRLGGGRLRAEGARHGPRQPVAGRRLGGVVLLRRARDLLAAARGLAARGRRPGPGDSGSRRPDHGVSRAAVPGVG